MVATDSGKSGLALLLTVSGTRPDVCAIGSGSGAVLVTNTDLIAQTDQSAFTTTDISTVKEVAFTIDFNSVDISGTLLTEFGIKVSGGDVWNREGFASVEFDGTNELQIQITYEVF